MRAIRHRGRLIVARLSREVIKALGSPDLREPLTSRWTAMSPRTGLRI